jgi:flagellum-specific ATP synthase
LTLPDLSRLLDAGAGVRRREVVGCVSSVTGNAIRCVGIDAAVGDLCEIEAQGEAVPAEVVGFGEDDVVLMPMFEPRGVGPGNAVRTTGKPLCVRAGDSALGRVLDGLGRPLDGGPAVMGREMPVMRDAPLPLDRPQIVQPIVTGVSAIDGFMTVGLGQRIGIFAGSGVGKSTLLGMIARGSSAHVNVIALIGERGREVKDFVEDVLGPEGMAKSLLIVATSDTSPLLRYKATFSAIAFAEYFRDQGKQVLFMMDSVTRFAAAAREIGLAAGEPPTLRGYPPSLFGVLPKVVERLGTTTRGGITGMFTVLVEGDDMNEPVSDTMRGLLDGHFVLDRKIAHRGQFPSINVLLSISRLMSRIADPQLQEGARELRKLLAHYEDNRDLIQVGAYQQGADPLLDRAVRAMPALEKLLYQGTTQRSPDETMQQIMLALRS